MSPDVTPDSVAQSGRTLRSADPAGIKVQVINELDEEAFKAALAKQKFFWVDLTDPSAEELDRLGSFFELHPLAIENAKRLRQRPKLEDFGKYFFLCFYGARAGARRDDDLLNIVHAFIFGECIITIRRGDFGALHELAQAISERTLRSEQYVVYEVLDAVVDTFFPMLAEMDDAIDQIEDEIIADPSERQLQRVFALKRQLVTLRRVVTPQRDIFARSVEQIAELSGLDSDSHDYFRDVYDHLIRISDLVDSYRDLLSGCTDLYLSTVANRQGEVSKQLTIIATYFLPLSVLTGFFGQNFAFLTGRIQDKAWQFYALGLGLPVITLCIITAFFRHKGWIGSGKRRPVTSIARASAATRPSNEDQP